MESVRDLVTFIQFQNDSSDVVLFSLDYIAWTANKVCLIFLLITLLTNKTNEI